MTHFALPYFWACFVEVIFYNAAALNLFYYLKRSHHLMWVELGSPSFLNNSIANNFKTFGFLWSARYLKLNDPGVNRRMWLVRGLFVLAPLMWSIGFICNLFPD